MEGLSRVKDFGINTVVNEEANFELNKCFEDKEA